ncbi:MAG: GNAT family N-acetyltransferase [Deltaproteobacteria bacterium]|nr:GNAT family N-acetyltransferase [Deltaproteobacteria bacterium]
MLTFEPLQPENFDRYAALQRDAGCGGCHCMFWHFEGDNRAWQLRDANDNCEAKRTLVDAQKTHGVLALRDGIAVGSLQLEPRASLTKLTQRMPYRDLEPLDAVWSIGCVLVHPDARKTGVATALVQAAVDHSARWFGARWLEAYPRLGDELRDEEQWMGPDVVYQRLGFELTREHMQYPVYRRELPRIVTL